MRRYRNFVVLLFIILLNACAERFELSPNHKDLIGVWHGKWDEVYSLKFEVINSNKEEYNLIYEWEENIGEAWKRQERQGKAKNKNSIEFGEILIRIDPFNKDQAQAIGVFTSMTRIADLTKSY
jgi:hypothetical protein